MIVTVTGGARSGKSAFAEKYVTTLGTEGIYMATAESLDEEMEQRILAHKLRRKESSATFSWITYEEPYELVRLLEQIRVESRSYKSKQRVVLVDCLTLWLSNLLLRNEHHTDEFLCTKINELTTQTKRMENPVLLVTNEVGYSLVPEYPLGRRFRDLAGWMNQQFAEISNEVFLVACGIPLELKSLAYRREVSPPK